MRPQWCVRPPTMRARHQSNLVPGAVVYGSPSMSHPPMHPSNSPNGRSLDPRPRRGDSKGHSIIFESVALSHGPPASSITTSAPACVSAYADMPPPAPEPTMHTSYVVRVPAACMALLRSVDRADPDVAVPHAIVVVLQLEGQAVGRHVIRRPLLVRRRPAQGDVVLHHHAVVEHR